MKKLLNPKILLFGIILLAFLLRFWQLGNIPSGFHADEAAFGYNAYSVLHTGKDEYGKFLPIVLKSFGDYKGAIYSYLQIPSILVFGLNPLAARFPSIIFSLLSILVLYFLVRDATHNKKIALITCFLMAISPWDIIVSRVVGDITVAVFFNILMAYALQKISEKEEKIWFIVAIISCIFAILTAPIFRFFVVLLSSIFLLLSINKSKGKLIFNKAILFIVVISLSFGILYSFIASVNRFTQVSIFSTPQTNLILQEQIRENQFASPIITRFFHNKIVNYTRTIIFNAGQYFTLDFLALNGGYPKRERVPDSGLLYIWEIPFLLIGIYSIIKSKNRNLILFIIWWFLLLVPSFITFDEIPNVHRTIVVLPAMSTIIAVGIYTFFNNIFSFNIKNVPVIGFVILVVVIFEFSYFLYQYFVYYDIHQAWYRGYAYKGLVEDLQKLYPKYKKIVITKALESPYIYILFYSKYDPTKYQAEGSPRDLDYTGFEKYYFVPADCPLAGNKEDEVSGKEEILYVDKGDCNTNAKNINVLDTIKWKDGNPAFKVVEYLK